VGLDNLACFAEKKGGVLIWFFFVSSVSSVSLWLEIGQEKFTTETQRPQRQPN